MSNAPPRRVVADSPAVRALQRAGDLAIRPKQAWTNVADFTSRGLDAVNFGPGHTAFAHHPQERVEIGSLVQAYEILSRFLASPMRRGCRMMELAQRIDELWESGELEAEPIEEAIARLDAGDVRVAERRA